MTNSDRVQQTVQRGRVGQQQAGRTAAAGSRGNQGSEVPGRERGRTVRQQEYGQEQPLPR